MPDQGSDYRREGDKHLRDLVDARIDGLKDAIDQLRKHDDEERDEQKEFRRAVHEELKSLRSSVDMIMRNWNQECASKHSVLANDLDKLEKAVQEHIITQETERSTLIGVAAVFTAIGSGIGVVVGILVEWFK